MNFFFLNYITATSSKFIKEVPTVGNYISIKLYLKSLIVYLFFKLLYSDACSYFFINVHWQCNFLTSFTNISKLLNIWSFFWKMLLFWFLRKVLRQVEDNAIFAKASSRRFMKSEKIIWILTSIALIPGYELIALVVRVRICSFQILRSIKWGNIL